MTTKDPYIDDKVAIIADFVGRDFMRLARELRQVQEQRSDLFVEVAKLLGIGQRRAFALARVARLFDELHVPDERLNKIGWAKLNRISGHLDEGNAEQLLSFCEKLTSHGLDVVLKGEQPVDGAKVVLLYLPEEVHDRFRALLLMHGAKPTVSGGLANKEQALASLIGEFAEP
jgi:hypothetical protein